MKLLHPVFLAVIIAFSQSLLSSSLAFSQTENHGQESTARENDLCPLDDDQTNLFTVEKGFAEDQFQAVKLAINTINKDILVEEGKDKTWRVYTKPIMRRKNIYLVKNTAGKILAYAAMKDSENYLSWIAVREGYRGKENGNLAKKLMSKILEDYEQIYLDVRASNARAVKFYQDLSDIAAIEVKAGKQYDNGEEGLIFVIGPQKKAGQVGPQRDLPTRPAL